MASRGNFNTVEDEFPDFDPDSFIGLPGWVLSELSPEEIRSRAEAYRVAFEQAREHVRRRMSDKAWFREAGIDIGDGI